MGRAWLLVVVAAVAGCRGLDGAFSCDVAQECVSGGVAGFCEANGSCSFPDPDCDSGRRYGSYAASDVRTLCVGDEPVVDSAPGIDARRVDAGPDDPDGAAPPADAATDPCDRPDPGPTTTGVPAGTTLTGYSGDLRIEVDGTVIEDLDIDGSIMIFANDVTIRRVRLTSGTYYPIRYNVDELNTGLVVEDSEIVLTGTDPTSAISAGPYTARRLNVHGANSGLVIGSNAVVEDSWIHDINGSGIGSGGGSNMVVRHNRIEQNYAGAIHIYDDYAAPRNTVIDCNYLDGGGWVIQVLGEGANVPSGTQITDNVFTRDFAYGPIDTSDPSPLVTGNTYFDGTPITW